MTDEAASPRASGAPMDLIGKTVEWHHDGLYGPKRWFTAFVTGRNGDAYVGTVVNPGNYGKGLAVGDEANNLKPHLCTVIDSEPVTEDEECE